MPTNKYACLIEYMTKVFLPGMLMSIVAGGGMGALAYYGSKYFVLFKNETQYEMIIPLFILLGGGIAFFIMFSDILRIIATIKSGSDQSK